MTLAEVLTPLSINEFLADYVGQELLFVPGAPGRFRSLVSWRELNTALAGLTMGDERVSLIKAGKAIPTSSYVYTSPSRRLSYLVGHSLRTHALNGATLVVNKVDQMLPRIRELVESCEDIFEVPVGANIYAAWKRDHGFDNHWDSHDTLILQVIGKKHWTVWRPTRVHPLVNDSTAVVSKPIDDPAWQGVLGDGNVLYMPRGWWHVASPCDEPSLHITIGIKHPTGADLLDWLLLRLRTFIDVRRDVPHWKGREERVAWTLALRDAMVATLNDDIIDEYIDSLVSAAVPRPIIRLPQTTTSPSPIRLGRQIPLRLVRMRRLRLHAGSAAKTIEFLTPGRRWQCHELLRPALSLLHGITPCSLQDMFKSVEAPALHLVEPFVMTLLTEAVIWADSSDSECEQ